MSRRRVLLALMALMALRVGRAGADEHLADIIDAIRPSIVGVGTYAATRTPPALLAGTGFVVGDGSLIATNHHVAVRQFDTKRNEKLVVFIGRGRDSSWREATLAQADETHDLVLLRIGGAALPALRLGDERPVREGTAIAFTGFPIGTVLGLYPATHRGIVSALTPIATPAANARTLSASKIAALADPYDVLQLDATAYPGNSGSPVYRESDGTVIGVINQVFVQGKKEDILSHPSAISYAVPARFLHALIQAMEQR